MMKWCTKEGLIIVIMWRVSLPVCIYVPKMNGIMKVLWKRNVQACDAFNLFAVSIIQLSGYD